MSADMTKKYTSSRMNNSVWWHWVADSVMPSWATSKCETQLSRRPSYRAVRSTCSHSNMAQKLFEAAMPLSSDTQANVLSTWFFHYLIWDKKMSIDYCFCVFYNQQSVWLFLAANLYAWLICDNVGRTVRPDVTTSTPSSKVLKNTVPIAVNW